MGEQGSVAWMFESKGQILIEKQNGLDDLPLELIDQGVEDVKEGEEGLEVYTLPMDLEKTKKFIENNLDCARIAVIISKKVSPKAVTRNLIKRRIHEALRTGQKNFLKKNFDVTVTAIPAIVGKDLKEINSNFDQTTKQIL